MTIAVLSPDWFFFDRFLDRCGRHSGEFTWSSSPSAWLKRKRIAKGWVIDVDQAWRITDWGILEAVSRSLPVVLVTQEIDSTLQLASSMPHAVVRSSEFLDAAELSVAMAISRTRIAEQKRIQSTASSKATESGSEISAFGKALRAALGPIAAAALELREASRWQARLADTRCGSLIPVTDSQSEIQKRMRLLDQIDRLTDAAALWDDRLGVRRESIDFEQAVREFAASAEGRIEFSSPINGLLVRADRRMIDGVLQEVVSTLFQHSSSCDLKVLEHQGLAQLECFGYETISMEEYAEVAAQWQQTSWPTKSLESGFNWGLGLARERIRCQGGDLKPVRDESGRFGWQMNLPCDEPAAVMTGFLAHLDRRLEGEIEQLGAFVIQTDAKDPQIWKQTEASLIESVGSCGYVHRCGDRTWTLIAPVGVEESGEFVQWLQQQWCQRLSGQSSEIEVPQIRLPYNLAISTSGHIERSAGVSGLTELLQDALANSGPLGVETPIVVISRSEPGMIDGLSRRLQQSGCCVTRISAETPCPDEWSEAGPSNAPVVLDLRTPEGFGWSRLDDLVREGSLNRQVFLLSEDLRRQNDRLFSFGMSWETPGDLEADSSLPEIDLPESWRIETAASE